MTHTDHVFYFLLYGLLTFQYASRRQFVHGFAPHRPFPIARHRYQPHRVSSRQCHITALQSTSTTIVDRSTLTRLDHVTWHVPDPTTLLPLYRDVLHLCTEGGSTDDADVSRKKVDVEGQLRLIQSTDSATDSKSSIVAPRPYKLGVRLQDWSAFENVWQDETTSKPSPTWDTDRLGQPIGEYTDPLTGTTLLCRPILLASQDSSSTSDSRVPPPLSSVLEFVEIGCRPGTAARIAQFYENVLDATTSVIQDKANDAAMAVIAIGNINEHGAAEQSLLFRETPSLDEQSESSLANGSSTSSIALVVGESAADFEQAYKNCEIAGVVWGNPSDDMPVDSLSKARDQRYYWTRQVVDLETGHVVLELTHKFMSIEYKEEIVT